MLVRDSGVVHALLNIPDHDALLGHPVVGGSWEAFVIEQILSVVPELTLASYYRSAAGQEIDLVLEHGSRTIAIEVKRSMAPMLESGFHAACKDVGVDEAFVVYPGQDTYPLNAGGTVMDLARSMSRLSDVR